MTDPASPISARPSHPQDLEFEKHLKALLQKTKVRQRNTICMNLFTNMRRLLCGFYRDYTKHQRKLLIGYP